MSNLNARLVRQAGARPRQAAAVAAIAGGAALIWLYGRYLAPLPQVEPTPVPTYDIPAVVAAEGEVVPVREAELSYRSGGRVEEVLVQAGDRAKAGQALMRLDTAELRLGLAQAEASLKRAEAQLDALLAGPRAEQVAVAQAGVRAAEAELARLRAGARPEEVAGAQAVVDKAASVLRQAQAEYDRVAHLPDVGRMPQSVALEQASADHRLAQARYNAVVGGASKDEIAAAQAAVDRARAELALLRAGASDEEITAAEAMVDEARSARDLAARAVQNATLRAPFDGVVGAVAARQGETVAPGVPVVRFGDISRFEVRTTDLSEVDIESVRAGQSVEITAEAVPDVTFRGRVKRVAPAAIELRGDKVYPVTIDLDRPSRSLRWGMTVFVDIDVSDR